MTTGLAAGTYEVFVGIDIAATTAEVSTQCPGAKAGRSFKIDQTPEGFTVLCTRSRPRIMNLPCPGRDGSDRVLLDELGDASGSRRVFG